MPDSLAEYFKDEEGYGKGVSVDLGEVLAIVREWRVRWGQIYKHLDPKAYSEKERKELSREWELRSNSAWHVERDLVMRLKKGKRHGKAKP